MESGTGTSAAASNAGRSPFFPGALICNSLIAADPKSTATGDAWAENIPNAIIRLQKAGIRQKVSDGQEKPSRAVVAFPEIRHVAPKRALKSIDPKHDLVKCWLKVK